MNEDTSITVRTLTDGGQPAAEVARWIAEFVGAAERTLDLAHYDFHLGAESAAIIGRAIAEAAARGVAVRFVYNVDHRNPIPVPPPPEPDAELIASLGVPARAIAGVPDLMHHKYVVRDGRSVWTGSMNWTDDSFAIQENVLATVDSAELATAITLDFDQLWTTGVVEKSGFVEPRPVDVGGRKVRAWFTPGFGEELSHRIAKRIGRARRVRICSPVITTAPVLATLAQLVSEGKTDVVVADSVVFLGSFNLSRSGELNAENVLEIEDAPLAERLAAYVDGVRARYPRFVLDGG